MVIYTVGIEIIVFIEYLIPTPSFFLQGFASIFVKEILLFKTVLKMILVNKEKFQFKYKIIS